MVRRIIKKSTAEIDPPMNIIEPSVITDKSNGGSSM